MVEQMKPSGIDWIGDIPQSWSLKRIKYVIEDIKDGTHGTFGRVDSGEPLLSAKNVFDDGLHISENESEISYEDYLQITSNGFPRKNDVLLCCVGTVGRCCVYIFDKPLAFQRSVSFLRPNKKTTSEYLKYLLQSDSTLVQEQLLINKSAQEGLYMGSVKELIIPYTEDLKEQKAIADFLDKQCGKIDEIISDLEKQIETLQKYKKSLILEAVTKGLNKNVPMKSSGIDWIGDIPQSWKLKRIKYLSTLKGRIGWQGLTADEYVDEGPFLITGTDFIDGTINWDTCVHITKERWAEAPEIHIKNGDLLITKDGTVGKVAIVSNLEGKASLNSGVLLIRTFEGFDKRFLYWVLLSDEFWVWFKLKNAGNSTIIHLYQNDFAEFCYTFPNVIEQKAIADFLDKQCGKIDSILKDKQEQLEKIKQHKKSLIYEYVTGKKRVKEATNGN